MRQIFRVRGLSTLRRSIAGLAVIALTLSAACGGDTPPAPAHSQPAAASGSPAEHALDDAPSEETVVQLLAPWKGDLDGMVERRYIRMLVTFSKTNYFLDGPHQYGATFEAGKRFEEFLNQRLRTKHIRVHVAFLPVSRDRLFLALAEGKGDIAAANLTITPERSKVAEFAKPFVTDVRELVVTTADQAELTGPEDLSGREVHVRRSSSYYESLVALNATLRAAGKPAVTIVEAPDQLEDEDLLEMINAGLVPATIVDNHKADVWAQVFTNITVHPRAAVRAGGQIAWALRRDTPQLAEVVNAFVAANPPGSLSYNLILQRYFKDTKWAKNATAEDDLRKYRQVVQFFKRYGKEYDFPWLLVAAQAYQESQIDQSRRSSAGAVGIMQIKPSTAAGSPINVRGVETSAERNIEAGVKYLRFIADRYFSDEPMDRLNKGLFTVASYNAGPARIAQLRKKAVNMGLDPNRWFGHVEVVAAREIGRETVQYVSNIYKYYVSYELISKQMETRRQARGQ